MKTLVQSSAQWVLSILYKVIQKSEQVGLIAKNVLFNFFVIMLVPKTKIAVQCGAQLVPSISFKNLQKIRKKGAGQKLGPSNNILNNCVSRNR